MHTMKTAIGQSKAVALFLVWAAVIGLSGCGGEGGDTAVSSPIEEEVATITSPASGDAVLVNTNAEITVSVPAGITDIELRSTLGTWSASGTNTQTWTDLSGPIDVSDTLTSTSQGTATIEVVNSSNGLVTDSIELSFVAEEVDAGSIVTVKATPATIGVSTDTTESTSVIEVLVTTASGGVIADAQVNFTLGNITGSGEYISPQVAYTNAHGVATATLYAGTQTTSGSGLIVTASLDETLTGTVVESSTNIFVLGVPASVAIGISPAVTSIYSDTSYSLPVALQVTDTLGNPIQGVEVGLDLWPLEYALGAWECVPSPGLVVETVLANEDQDRDGVLDLAPVSEDVSGDGELTPSAADGGVIPAVVTTDEFGLAQFNIIYPKDRAGFINDVMTASVTVSGIEVTGSRHFWLPALADDVSSCSLGVSPYNYSWPSISAVATLSTVTVGGSSDIIVSVTDSTGALLEGQEVYAEFVQLGSSGTTPPTLTSSPQITDAYGLTNFTYTAGDLVGVDEIRFYYVSSGVYLSDYVQISTE